MKYRPGFHLPRFYFQKIAPLKSPGGVYFVRTARQNRVAAEAGIEGPGTHQMVGRKLYPQNWTLVKGGVPISQTLEKGAFPW